METVEGFLKAGMKRSFASTAAEVAGTEQLEEATAANNPKTPLISCPPPLAPAIANILRGPVLSPKEAQPQSSTSTVIPIR